MQEEFSKDIIEELSFCVIDLETTGGHHSKDKIIEIGMVKIHKLRVIDQKSSLINPQIPIPQFIQKLTSISQKTVKDAPIIEDLIDEILEFIGDDIIVAHNTSFDVPFLNSILQRLGREKLTNNVICTNVMTKHLIPEILNSNLNYMSRLFKVEHSKAHRAYDDALATAKLLIIYLHIFIGKGIKKVNQLYYPRNKFELDRAHFDSKQSTEDVISFISSRTTSMLITIKGERGLILAVIPLEDPSQEKQIVREVLDLLDWELITIRLMKPMIEGLFQFNNHFFKYSKTIQTKVLTYLEQKYIQNNIKPRTVEQLDFIIAHHLVTDQVTVYSFLHLNTNTKNLFKIPAQKKKLYQYLSNQISRFESHQKGRKKTLIHKELTPLIEHFLHSNRGQNKYLFLDRKEIKNDKDSILNTVESFVGEDRNDFNFPVEHL